MKRWMLGLLAVLCSATLAAAQQQPTTPVTPQRGDIPQIVAFDNEGLLGDHIHIFGNTPDLGKWGIVSPDGGPLGAGNCLMRKSFRAPRWSWGRGAICMSKTTA